LEIQEFNKVIKIVDDRLVRIAPEAKNVLPTILQGKMDFFTFLNDSYFALFFVDDADKDRIRDLRDRKIQPFPFLVKPKEIVAGSAFSFDKSKFVWLEKCVVKNMFSLTLGKDSTVILVDHKQIINTKELGNYEFLVKLAYVISFGEEINRENFFVALEDLIAYSLKSWANKK
jgi:hypothetical protein